MFVFTALFSIAYADNTTTTASNATCDSYLDYSYYFDAGLQPCTACVTAPIAGGCQWCVGTNTYTAINDTGVNVCIPKGTTCPTNTSTSIAAADKCIFDINANCGFLPDCASCLANSTCMFCTASDGSTSCNIAGATCPDPAFPTKATTCPPTPAPTPAPDCSTLKCTECVAAYNCEFCVSNGTDEFADYKAGTCIDLLKNQTCAAGTGYGFDAAYCPDFTGKTYTYVYGNVTVIKPATTAASPTPAPKPTPTLPPGHTFPPTPPPPTPPTKPGQTTTTKPAVPTPPTPSTSKGATPTATAPTPAVTNKTKSAASLLLASAILVIAVTACI